MSQPSFFEPTLAQIVAAQSSGLGWCRSCGSEHDGIEPDAQNYTCEECADHEVFGGEEYLLNGWVKSQPETKERNLSND